MKWLKTSMITSAPRGALRPADIQTDDLPVKRGRQSAAACHAKADVARCRTIKTTQPRKAARPGEKRNDRHVCGAEIRSTRRAARAPAVLEMAPQFLHPGVLR